MKKKKKWPRQCIDAEQNFLPETVPPATVDGRSEISDRKVFVDCRKNNNKKKKTIRLIRI